MSDAQPPRRGTTFTPIISLRTDPGPTLAESDGDALALLVVEGMLEKDLFSQWLGVSIIEAGVKHATVRMTVRPEMVNAFGSAHGGIVYALADTAFAFASNSNGEMSVALDTSMSYPTAVRPGDVLTAVGVEETSTRRLGFCEVTVRNQDDAVVGHFRGTIYRTMKPLP